MYSFLHQTPSDTNCTFAYRCRPENEGRLCRTLCDSLSCIVISPDYIKAPHHPFPAALNQCHAMLRWIADPAGLLQFLETQGPPSGKTFVPLIDPTKIALSGGSSGGNLVAALIIKGLHSQLPLPNNAKLVGVALLYAMLDISMPYSEKLAHVPDKSKVLPRWLTRLFLDGYLSELRTPDKYYKLKDPLLSPGLCSTEDLKRFPKTVVITAENDYLCHEGEVFADRLENEAGFTPGKNLIRKTFKNVGHGFDLNPNSTPEMDAAREEAWGMITSAFDSEL
jgi:acetyl esterase